MERKKHFDFIEEKLSWLKTRIEHRSKLNLVEFNIHSETFYEHLLNIVYKWRLKNENINNSNAAAKDLRDDTNKILIQVSSTASKQKIENTLSQEIIKNYASYTFKFVFIAGGADNLRNKNFNNPHKIQFNPPTDIIDIGTILKTILSFDTDRLVAVRELIEKELGSENSFFKIETNLADVINILSKQANNKQIPVSVSKAFEIEEKISFNNLNNIQPIIDDYKVYYGVVDTIYTTFDNEGVNKSISVLDSIRSEYLKLNGKKHVDDIFWEIIYILQDKVKKSSNFSFIPSEELERCISIIVVDAFIRCKIFENPNP